MRPVSGRRRPVRAAAYTRCVVRANTRCMFSHPLPRPFLVLAALAVWPASVVLGAPGPTGTSAPPPAESAGVALFTADERPAPWAMPSAAREHLLPLSTSGMAPPRTGPRPDAVVNLQR